MASFSAAHAAWVALAGAAQEPALAAWSEQHLLASLATTPVALAFLAEHASARYLDKKGGVTEMATLEGLNLTAAELRSNIGILCASLEIASPSSSAFNEPAAHAQTWEALFTEIRGVMDTVSIAGKPAGSFQTPSRAMGRPKPGHTGGKSRAAAPASAVKAPLPALASAAVSSTPVAAAAGAAAGNAAPGSAMTSFVASVGSSILEMFSPSAGAEAGPAASALALDATSLQRMHDEREAYYNRTLRLESEISRLETALRAAQSEIVSDRSASAGLTEALTSQRAEGEAAAARASEEVQRAQARADAAEAAAAEAHAAAAAASRAAAVAKEEAAALVAAAEAKAASTATSSEASLVAAVAAHEAALVRATEEVRSLRAELESTKAGAVAAADAAAAQLAAMAASVAAATAAADRRVADADGRFTREQAERRRLWNKLQEAKGNIRVLARVRPVLPSEAAAASADASNADVAAVVIRAASQHEIVVAETVGEGATGRVRGKDAVSLEFDRVLGAEEGQLALWDELQPLITSALDGYHATIFAYGQTGSGKTHTMEGGSAEEERGVYSRALGELFALAATRAEDGWMTGVKASMVEIYNERARDLLAPPSSSSNDVAMDAEDGEGAAGGEGESEGVGGGKDVNPNNLIIKTGAHGGQVLVGVTTLDVSSPADVMAVMARGAAGRTIGRTNMNEHSSRSHCLLLIEVVGTNTVTGVTCNGKLTLVDLAGSERVGKSGVVGGRLKEAQAINKSLSALGDVIAALASKAPHVPFRNSTLTWLLADALGKDNKVAMIVQVAPTAACRGESLCSLQFAGRVKKVELGKAQKHGDATGELGRARAEAKREREAREKAEAAAAAATAGLEGRERMAEAAARKAVADAEERGRAEAAGLKKALTALQSNVERAEARAKVDREAAVKEGRAAADRESRARKAAPAPAPPAPARAAAAKPPVPAARRTASTASARTSNADVAPSLSSTMTSFAGSVEEEVEEEEGAAEAAVAEAEAAEAEAEAEAAEAEAEAEVLSSSMCSGLDATVIMQRLLGGTKRDAASTCLGDSSSVGGSLLGASGSASAALFPPTPAGLPPSFVGQDAEMEEALLLGGVPVLTPAFTATFAAGTPSYPSLSTVARSITASLGALMGGLGGGEQGLAASASAPPTAEAVEAAPALAAPAPEPEEIEEEQDGMEAEAAEEEEVHEAEVPSAPAPEVAAPKPTRALAAKAHAAAAPKAGLSTAGATPRATSAGRSRVAPKPAVPAPAKAALATTRRPIAAAPPAVPKGKGKGTPATEGRQARTAVAVKEEEGMAAKGGSRELARAAGIASPRPISILVKRGRRGSAAAAAAAAAAEGGGAAAEGGAPEEEGPARKTRKRGARVVFASGCEDEGEGAEDEVEAALERGAAEEVPVEQPAEEDEEEGADKGNGGEELPIAEAAVGEGGEEEEAPHPTGATLAASPPVLPPASLLGHTLPGAAWGAFPALPPLPAYAPYDAYSLAAQLAAVGVPSNLPVSLGAKRPGVPLMPGAAMLGGGLKKARTATSAGPAARVLRTDENSGPAGKPKAGGSGGSAGGAAAGGLRTRR